MSGDSAEQAGASAPAAGAAQDVFLRRLLALEEVPCPRCGYNLHQLTGARCPECGEELQLWVRSGESLLGVWAYFAAVMYAAAGIGCDLGGIMLQGQLRFHRPPVWPLYFSISSFMLFILGAVAAFVWRRRFCELSRRAQWSATLFAASMAAALVSLFLFGLRE